MSGIRINAAAEMLGVSTSTLRSWERRLGYPQPARTPGNHRLYELDEVEALRAALRETHNISARSRSPACAAAAPPPRRAWSPPSTASTRPPPTASSSRASRCARSSAPSPSSCCPRSSSPRGGRNARRRARARLPLGDRVAARRAPPGRQRDPRRGRAAARLGLAPRRRGRPRRRRSSSSCAGPGCGVLLLSAGLAEGRFRSALRALDPAGGRDLRLRGAARRARRPAAGAAQRRRRAPRLYGYRAARLVAGRDGVPSLGAEPGEATALRCWPRSMA